MKKIFYLPILTLTLFALAACSTAQASDTATNSTTDPVNQTTTDGLTNMQLALGTFILEDTDNAVTAEQAAELLPLWKAAQSLSDSDTITTEEFQAVFKQIQETLTPEQLNAITTTEVTPEQMSTISEKYGITFGPGGGGNFDPSSLTEEQLATREAIQAERQANGDGGGFGPPDGGGFPGGAPPDGGFAGGGPGSGFPGGGDIGSLPEAQQTAIASGAGRQGFGGGGLPSGFYDAIIQFLEGKMR